MSAPNDDQVARAMLEAVAAYLKEHGWRVAVIGTPRVQQQPDDLKLNFEFVVRFTGVPPADLKPPERWP